MRALLDVILIGLDIYIWILIAQAILSWLLVFNVVNARNQVVAVIYSFTRAVTEPLLKPIRKVVPPFGARKQYGTVSGGVDLSPIILLLLIYLVQRIIIYYIYPNVF